MTEHRVWPSNLEPGLPRRARRGCEYDVYLPDNLEGRPLLLQGDTLADVTDAERAVTRLNVEAQALLNSEAIARLLLRAEAVASSKIEGLEVGGRRLLQAQAARGLGEDPSDVTSKEILNNIDAMSWAIDTLSDVQTITVEDLLNIHERLLAGTSLEEYAGRLREKQNWIGGSDYNPCTAAFVPPPHEAVRPLLEDLCAFSSDDSLPAIVQAALAHAQFETIHPFVDGNGRTGRTLIHVIMRRRGLAPRVLPPISLVLATWSRDYVQGLTATRYLDPPDSASAQDGLNQWIGLFAAATKRAVSDAETYEARVRDLQTLWRQRLGKVRTGSAMALILDALPGAPILTVQSAASLIGRTEQAVNSALPRLQEAGVLRQVTVGRRNRAFEAPELIDVFTDLERQLASPRGDTRTSEPTRRVPQRRSRKDPSG
jgi:Fic family protein